MAGTIIQGKVLIVGGGPAGLALAQLLRKQGVPFEIFERDDEVHSRKQGWAVILIECLAPLIKGLPQDLGSIEQTSVNHNINVRDSLAIVDANSGEVVDVVGGSPPETAGYALRVDRELLRRYLAQNIVVQGGKIFDHYQEDAEGVIAHFRDGTSSRGSVLVGVDGAHSRVRSQLLGNAAQPVLSRYMNILGECTLTPEVFRPIRELGTCGVIGAKAGYRMLIGQRNINPEMSAADFYWTVNYQTEDPETETQKLAKLSQKELYDKALEASQGVSEKLLEVVRNSKIEDIIQPPIKFTEFVSPETIPAGKVTLMGDALHTMIPFRAAGANTALLDSTDLASKVAEGLTSENGLDWAHVLQQYHAIALPRGRRMVLASRAAGESWEDNTKSLSLGRVDTPLP